MTDITTKLRSGEHGWLPGLSCDAADEIDRLRAEVAGLRECGLAIGALSSAMGNPCVKANENGISGGLVELALHRIAVRDEWYANALNELDEKRSEIARLREALESIANPLNILGSYHIKAVKQARAALAPAAEVSGG